MSYDETLPTDLDRARSLLGDTTTPELHSDAHINAVLAAQGSLGLAVAYLAYELVLRFEQRPVRLSDQGTMLDYSERLKAWRALAAPVLASQVTTTASSPLEFVDATYSGGDTPDEYARPSIWNPTT